MYFPCDDLKVLRINPYRTFSLWFYLLLNSVTLETLGSLLGTIHSYLIPSLPTTLKEVRVG